MSSVRVARSPLRSRPEELALRDGLERPIATRGPIEWNPCVSAAVQLRVEEHGMHRMGRKLHSARAAVRRAACRPSLSTKVFSWFHMVLQEVEKVLHHGLHRHAPAGWRGPRAHLFP